MLPHLRTTYLAYYTLGKAGPIDLQLRSISQLSMLFFSNQPYLSISYSLFVCCWLSMLPHLRTTYLAYYASGKAGPIDLQLRSISQLSMLFFSNQPCLSISYGLFVYCWLSMLPHLRTSYLAYYALGKAGPIDLQLRSISQLSMLFFSNQPCLSISYGLFVCCWLSMFSWGMGGGVVSCAVR